MSEACPARVWELLDTIWSVPGAPRSEKKRAWERVRRFLRLVAFNRILIPVY